MTLCLSTDCIDKDIGYACIFDVSLYTAAVDNLLCMKNAGTQCSMVSYLKDLRKIKILKRKNPVAV